jgi:hypothetical protein
MFIQLTIFLDLVKLLFHIIINFNFKKEMLYLFLICYIKYKMKYVCIQKNIYLYLTLFLSVIFNNSPIYELYFYLFLI